MPFAACQRRVVIALQCGQVGKSFTTRILSSDAITFVLATAATATGQGT